jgi:hypothetical protein
MRCLALSLLVVIGCATDSGGRPDVAGVGGVGSEAATASGVDVAAAIGGFSEVDGTPFLRANLGTDRGGGYSVSGRGEYVETTNVLFYDTRSREGRWLFPEADQVVLQSAELRDSTRVRAFLYVLLEADTNGDGDLDADDGRTVALSDPGGRRLVRLTERARRFRQSVRLGDGAELVLFDDADGVQAVEVGLDALDVRARTTMPAPPAGDP